MAKTRKLTIKEKALRFSQGVHKIEDKHKGDLLKQSVEANKLYKKLEKKRVKKR